MIENEAVPRPSEPARPQKVNYSGVGGTDASGRPLPGQAALYRSLAKATMMITNLPPAALESWGLAARQT